MLSCYALDTRGFHAIEHRMTLHCGLHCLLGQETRRLMELLGIAKRYEMLFALVGRLISCTRLRLIRWWG